MIRRISVIGMMRSILQEVFCQQPSATVKCRLVNMIRMISLIGIGIGMMKASARSILQATIGDCQPDQLFNPAISKTPAMCQVYKQVPKSAHNCFEILPQVLASTCSTGVHVSCSFGVPNHGQSPTELGLNYVSAGQLASTSQALAPQELTLGLA